MRWWLVGCFLVFLPLVGTSQDVPTVIRDAQALALAQHVLSAGGGPLSASAGTLTTGTLQIGKDPTRYPMRIYTLGNTQTRTEVDRSTGMSVRILNKGEAALQQNTGKIIRLNILNTLRERIPYVPAFSLLSEYALPNMQLEYLGPALLSSLKVEQIAVSWGGDGTASDQKEFLKRTKVVYSIDPDTYQVIQMEYDICGEQDSSALRHYRLVYSDYKMVGGRDIPTTITTFAKDDFVSEFKIVSYTENADVSLVSFALPEATK